jgi:hypothetical protein
MRTMIVGLTLLHLTLAQNASAQTNTYTPRGYPYDSSVCTGGYQACFNRYLKVGWQSAAASSYCSQACRDYPPARRSK